MKVIRHYLPLLVLLLSCFQFAHAQSGVDFAVGFGSAWDKSLGLVDINTFLPCTTVTTSCSPTADLSGFMLGVSGNLMLWKRLGIGGEVSFQPKKSDYLTFQQQGVGTFGDVLQSRVTFFDFNGILQPIASKKASLQFQGGIGGANVKFYEKLTSSSAVLGNSNSSQFFGSSNHFQVHGGMGVQIFVTDHVFIRPQFDVHYVHNFSQFGRNLVPSATVWVGYSIGDR